MIHVWGNELGFQQVGITDTDLNEHEQYLDQWLAKSFHGEMAYMASHGRMRSRPADLLENTKRVISVRMDYLPSETNPLEVLASDRKAYVARYTLGRDYHKVIRKRLVKLWNQVRDYLKCHDHPDHIGRVFTDSAPVLEKALAEKAGLGWIGKNTLLLNRDAGPWFFLGEIFTSIPLISDRPYAEDHCGSCTACIDICPTKAIVAPYQLDARRCISYLTIENRGSIPVEFRPAMGNRIFGCDDCMLFCPWDKFARYTGETDFSPRHELDSALLMKLFSWSEDDFLTNTQGSAIRRTGYDGWLRNIAVALGNAAYDESIIRLLEEKKHRVSTMVAEHIVWAIDRQAQKGKSVSIHPA